MAKLLAAGLEGEALFSEMDAASKEVPAADVGAAIMCVSGAGRGSGDGWHAGDGRVEALSPTES